MTSPKQISLFTGEPLTFYPVDFPANHSALQGNAKEQKIHAICGQKCCEQYAKFNHATLWGKTLLEYLTGTTELFSNKCILTWRMKGTKFKRLYFQLVPSMRRIAGTEFGLLLKTPCSADAFTENMTKKEQVFGNSGTLAQEVQTGFIYQRGLLPTPQSRDEKNGSKITDGRIQRKLNQGWTIDLNDMATSGLLPTPTAMDGTGTTAKMKSTQVKEGSMHSVTLARAVNMGLLPTPTVNDMKNASLPPSQIDRNDSIVKRILLENPEAGKTSQLNPRFVAEMMGFPPNWTELPFQSGETNQSKHTETQ